MSTAFAPPRGGSAGATGAPNLPGIDYHTYRRKAAQLRAEAYRQAGLALRQALVEAIRGAGRAVKRLTDALRASHNTAPLSRSEILKAHSPLAIHMPQLLRANDNMASRRSERA
jgi:hypothetical protein